MSSSVQRPIITTLPTPREFLTSLLTTFPLPPPSKQTTSSENQRINPSYNPPSNPLKTVPSSYRALLSTLHVIFPQPMLLHALDLLDRGLVVRLVERVPSNLEEKEQRRGVVLVSPQAGVHLPESQDEMTRRGEERWKNVVYQVRSSQAPKSRFKDPSSSTGSGCLVYMVRLQAWNCSCAAFAFAAFPGGSRTQASWLEGSDSDTEGESKGGEEWEFGGSSFDDNVPVCKHLLACLLGERWGNILGGYIKEILVGRQEMAGVGGEG